MAGAPLGLGSRLEAGPAPPRVSTSRNASEAHQRPLRIVPGRLRCHWRCLSKYGGNECGYPQIETEAFWALPCEGIHGRRTGAFAHTDKVAQRFLRSLRTRGKSGRLASGLAIHPTDHFRPVGGAIRNSRFRSFAQGPIRAVSSYRSISTANQANCGAQRADNRLGTVRAFIDTDSVRHSRTRGAATMLMPEKTGWRVNQE